jgi:hypothetical protein
MYNLINIADKPMFLSDIQLVVLSHGFGFMKAFPSSRIRTQAHVCGLAFSCLKFLCYCLVGRCFVRAVSNSCVIILHTSLILRNESYKQLRGLFLLGAFRKITDNDYLLRHACLSVSVRIKKIRLQLDGFS